MRYIIILVSSRSSLAFANFSSDALKLLRFSGADARHGTDFTETMGGGG